MKIFGMNIGKKKLDWDNLTDKQKVFATSRLKSIIKNMAGSRYKVVSGPDQWNREQGLTETKGEGGILNKYQRSRLLSLCRNQMRNSPTFQSITRSLIQNSIGVNGGKLIIDLPDEEMNKEIMNKFKRFGKNADFFSGNNWNQTLKTIFLEYILGGDCIILFDSGYVTGSNKVIVFESDEIGDVDEKTIHKHYGKNSTCENGVVYDQYGREIGAIVSRACRGMNQFDPDKCYFLKKDPDGLPEECDWIMPKNIFRSAQHRGITSMTAMLANNEDLEMLTNFELQSAKQASQTLMQIYKESGNADEVIPSAFENYDFENMTDQEIEQVAKEEVEEEQTVSMQALQSANVIYQVLPDQYKAQLIDTKRPNPNLPAFIEFLCQRSGMPYGLTKQYITLATSDSEYRAQSLISKPAFEEISHFCEQICDWVFARWVVSNGYDKVLPIDYMDYVDWEWADIAELDRNEYQDYVNKGLANLTLTYKEVLGSNWKKKLQQAKLECEYFDKELKTLHPSLSLISGGESIYTERKEGEIPTKPPSTEND